MSAKAARKARKRRKDAERLILERQDQEFRAKLMSESTRKLFVRARTLGVGQKLLEYLLDNEPTEIKPSVEELIFEGESVLRERSLRAAAKRKEEAAKREEEAAAAAVAEAAEAAARAARAEVEAEGPVQGIDFF